MTNKIVLSIATALLLSSPALADDRLQASGQQASRPQGGLVNNLPGAEPSSQAPTIVAPAVEPSLPIEAPSSQSAVAPSGQAAASPALPSLPLESQAAPVAVSPSPSLQLPGALGEPSLEPFPVTEVGPAQGFPVTEVGSQEPFPVTELGQQQAGPSQGEAERPGFFKRMWAKVKSFAAKVRDKLRRSPRAEAAPAIDYQSPSD